MIILSIILLAACAAVFFVFMHVHVCAIKRKFVVKQAAFDLLAKQYETKCMMYDELADCIVKTPLPDSVFRYPLCKKCVRAYLNDEHICSEIYCLPLDKVDRDEMHGYASYIPLKEAAIFYMANRLKPAVEKE